MKSEYLTSNQARARINLDSSQAGGSQQPIPYDVAPATVIPAVTIQLEQFPQLPHDGPSDSFASQYQETPIPHSTTFDDDGRHDEPYVEPNVRAHATTNTEMYHDAHYVGASLPRPTGYPTEAEEFQLAFTNSGSLQLDGHNNTNPFTPLNKSESSTIPLSPESQHFLQVIESMLDAPRSGGDYDVPIEDGPPNEEELPFYSGDEKEDSLYDEY